jgi:DNA-binding NarL/FixJ family response regulator
MLIVEDQEVLRRSLRDYLQSQFPQQRILEAGDGATALRLCREHAPRIVLMDVGLPDANGIELTTQIKHMLPDSQIIVITTMSGKTHAEHALAAGACAFVEKNAIDEALLPALHAALARHGAAGNHTGNP